MKEVTDDQALDAALMEHEVNSYDATIARGKPLLTTTSCAALPSYATGGATV
jgi:hypothetical protein